MQMGGPTYLLRGPRGPAIFRRWPRFFQRLESGFGPAPAMRRAAGLLRWLACGAVVALFCAYIARFHMPGKGFTSLDNFSTANHGRYIPELKAADHYELPVTAGYDAQWYAQIAMRPHLGDPVLRAAEDRLSYRARRILFEIIPWVLAGGDPGRALTLYAWQNIACWFLLAILLLRWLPPSSFQNVLRWSAVLGSFGLVFSVSRALLDGPALLLLAAAMAVLESGRPWAGSALLGLCGLAKETSVLGVAALPFPASGGRREWGRWLARSAVVVAPIAAWVLFLGFGSQGEDRLGMRNFAGPFVGLIHKVQGIASGLWGGDPAPAHVYFEAFVIVGLASQAAFFAVYRDWRNPWWRVGASYAVLMLFLGDAVWEDHPSAAARVLLPMTLAFNLAVPRGRRWIALLVAGNLGALGSPDLLKPPNRTVEGYSVEGPVELRLDPISGREVSVTYGPVDWWQAEGEGKDYWHWSSGECSVTIHNPQPFPIVADLEVGFATVDAREAVVSVGGKVAWKGTLKPAAENHARIPGVVFPAGDTTVGFTSDRPAVPTGGKDGRLLMYSLRDLTLVLTSRGP